MFFNLVKLARFMGRKIKGDRLSGHSCHLLSVAFPLLAGSILDVVKRVYTRLTPLIAL